MFISAGPVCDGASECAMLGVQTNLAVTYGDLGHHEKALSMQRDVYSGRLKLQGEEQRETLLAAINYASSLCQLQRHTEGKPLMRKSIPVARRVLGESNEITLKMRLLYAMTLYVDPGATLEDHREAVTTLEEIGPTARRVLGGAHPLTTGIEDELRNARAALRGVRARETQPSSAGSA